MKRTVYLDSTIPGYLYDQRKEIKTFVDITKKTGDAVHLAYASYYKMDFLLTWNCSHLANANKKDHIRRINAMLNLPTPEIITPLELFQEEKDD
jgi:hypothetical protein